MYPVKKAGVGGGVGCRGGGGGGGVAFALPSNSIT